MERFSRRLVVVLTSDSRLLGKYSFLSASLLIILLSISVLSSVAGQPNKDRNKSDKKCPGLDQRWGVSVECLLTTRGVQTFNCSSPVPIGTVAYYSCQRFFKQVYASSPVKLLRCDQNGKWTRMENFIQLKCEYECGKAQPIKKTLIINGRIATRTIWPWHALIYYRFHPSDLDFLADGSSPVASEVLFDLTGKLTSFKNASNSFDKPNRVKRDLGNPRGSNRLDEDFVHIYVCGGTLISPEKIITAAHCLTNITGGTRKSSEFTVILGGISNSYDLNQQDSSSQTFSVSKIFVSDAFNYEQYEGDIAIIQLNKPAKFSSVVLPVCLPENLDDAHLFISSGKHGEVIGSKPEITREGIGLSNQLRSKQLHVLPTIECARNIDRIPSDKEYCAGMTDEFICSGDSGGGMISSPNYGLRRRYTIQGIVSYARARRICDNYAVFTRVYKFIDWIKLISFNKQP